MIKDIKYTLTLIISFLAAIFVRKSGIDKNKGDNYEKEQKALKDAKTVSDNINSTSDDDIDDKLRKWTR